MLPAQSENVANAVFVEVVISLPPSAHLRNDPTGFVAVAFIG